MPTRVTKDIKEWMTRSKARLEQEQREKGIDQGSLPSGGNHESKRDEWLTKKLEKAIKKTDKK